MTKPEILEVVKQMLVDWQNAQKLDTAFQVVKKTKCYRGFCFWFYDKSIMIDKEIPILKELGKDRNHELILNYQYWYITLDHSFQNFSETLQTRIDHLNRTIARLENEIANENL